jgi:hypothetical protein
MAGFVSSVKISEIDIDVETSQRKGADLEIQHESCVSVSSEGTLELIYSWSDIERKDRGQVLQSNIGEHALKLSKHPV